MTRVPVLLALDGPLFADALRVALSGTALEVIGRTHDVEATVSLARARDPALLVVAANLPGPGGGLAACSRVMAEETLRTLALVIGDPGSEEEMRAALEAGALGYATSTSSLADLIEDMQGVVGGEARVPRLMLGGLLRSLITRERKSSDMLDRYASLSRRERETLGLLARGLDHTAIAEQLVISPQTARTHIQNVLGKLGVHSRLEAATLALENGWVNVEGELPV